MTKPKWPCVRDCERRSAFCRLSCAAYAEYEKELFEYREAKDKQRKKSVDVPWNTAAHDRRIRRAEEAIRRGRLR